MGHKLAERSKVPRVLNKRIDTIPPDAVYGGRPGPFGNWYRIGQPFHGHPMTREECVEEHRKDFLNNPALIAKVKKHKDKDWWCWCAPDLCHCNIYLRVANEKEGDGSQP